MSKSHVSMEQKVCEVCGKPFDTNAILLDRRLQERLEFTTITGWGLCPEDQKLYNDGYIALVECKNTPTGKMKDEMQRSAQRTGELCHIRRTLAKQIFAVDLGDTTSMAFVEVGVIDKLRSMQQAS